MRVEHVRAVHMSVLEVDEVVSTVLLASRVEYEGREFILFVSLLTALCAPSIEPHGEGDTHFRGYLFTFKKK